ncbi:hypothetical protein PYW07_011968 [Mythimna separata]|uniref:BZIP domain-containing protein n=1 Tax=Mythimna separata TaxID=271217 RepID=A0AAD8DSF5_MYTSE|nr:hypothetical protein PYW07_011968 [Mythimna separata]
MTLIDPSCCPTVGAVGSGGRGAPAPPAPLHRAPPPGHIKTRGQPLPSSFVDPTTQQQNVFVDSLPGRRTAGLVEVRGASQPGGSSSGCGPASRHCAAHLMLSPPASLSPPGAPEHRPNTTDAGALSDDPDFQEFERRGLEVLAAKNGGALVGDNPRMRRSVRASSAAAADAAYRSQRERNNHAAKQSRDRRKLREIHLSLKAEYLQRRVVALQAALRRNVCGRCNRSAE